MINEYFFDGVYLVENELPIDTYVSLTSDQYNWCFVLLSGKVLVTESNRGENDIKVYLQPPGIVYMRRGWRYEFAAMEESRFLTIQGWIVASPIWSQIDEK